MVVRASSTHLTGQLARESPPVSVDGQPPLRAARTSRFDPDLLASRGLSGERRAESRRRPSCRARAGVLVAEVRPGHCGNRRYVRREPRASIRLWWPHVGFSRRVACLDVIARLRATKSSVSGESAPESRREVLAARVPGFRFARGVDLNAISTRSATWIRGRILGDLRLGAGQATRARRRAGRRGAGLRSRGDVRERRGNRLAARRGDPVGGLDAVRNAEPGAERPAAATMVWFAGTSPPFIAAPVAEAMSLAE